FRPEPHAGGGSAMTTIEPQPVLPTPDCAMFAPLLPLLDSYDLSPEEAARAREHLNTCAWCQREYAAHAIVDGALRRHFGELSPGTPPFLTMENIVNTIDTQDPSTQPSTGFAPTTPLAEQPNRPQYRPGRLTGIAAVAAALL